VAQVYQFGPFTLDAGRRRLLRHGEIITVPPKALDVLHVLLDNRGRTVDKGDLMSRVWRDAIVEEANLTQSVFVLRRALGDEPSDPQYISTVARRGYRFVGNVSETGSEPLLNERRRVHRTASLEAYHAYVKGRHYWSKRDVDGVRAALGYFRQAIDLDPTYALAYVGLAECFLVLRGHSWPCAPDALLTAKAAASRALEIDDTIGEAHAALGLIRMTSEWNWVGAEQSFGCAIELAPDYATARNWWANYLAAQGRFDDAIREAAEAVRLDPLSVTWRMGVGHMLFLARRYAESVDTELSALEMDPQFWLAHWVLGLAYEQLGDLSRATAALRQADDLSGGNLMVLGLVGRMHALCGRIDEAQMILQDLITRPARQAPPAEIVGLVHASLGDTDAAFECFHRAARDGSYLLSFLNVSPLFDSLRSQEPFASLQRVLGLA
jgi:DNA-binding winged helix-turn-helix (wHTH) protein/Tfp pilus assembly protein PilF